jgi:hypothetical protein
MEVSLAFVSVFLGFVFILCSNSFLPQRVQEMSYDLKASGSNALQYCMRGVGGDASCSLQMPLDCLRFIDIVNIDQYSQDMPHNAVKFQLTKFVNISKAVECVRKARSVKWPLNIVSNNSSVQAAETPDTFLADFAVGVGAGQLMAGGLHTAECAAKYNRILEVIEESPSIRFVKQKFRK